MQEAIGVTTMMVVMQLLHVGLNTLIKASISKGMSNYVFIPYSNTLAFCFLLPSTIFYHRNKAPPPINRSIIFRIFVLSLLSCSGQTLRYNGIRFSSPTLASAMEDLDPAYTFMLAIISRFPIFLLCSRILFLFWMPFFSVFSIRMEKLDMRERSCKAKTIGTVVSILGALMVTLYKGLPLMNNSHMLPNNYLSDGTFLSSSSLRSEWLFGGFLLAAGNLCVSTLLVVQTWTIKDYPAELMLTTICCSFVVILSASVAFIAEKNLKAWIIKPDMELLSIFYSAIFVISVRSVVQTWACRKKGPVYVAMFNPLGIVIALAMGVIFLGDTVYLGSIIGAAIIACGFYGVIWGQAQEEKSGNDEKNGACGFESSSSYPEAPLLQNVQKQ